MTKHRFGYKRDAIDTRDQHFGLVRPHVSLPPKFDLLDRMPYVQDQGETNACIFYSLASIIQHLDRANTADDDEWFPSPYFMYWVTRNLEGDVEADDGAQIRNAIKAVAQFGACPNDYWSENQPITKKPDEQAFAAAKQNLIGRYSRVAQSLDGIRSCLFAGHPFLFGFQVFPQFEGDQIAANGLLLMPEGDPLGGHCVVAVGYDDIAQMVLVRNSYGDKWGLPTVKGHFLMPYRYITNPTLVSDLWTVQSVGEISEA